MKLVDSALLAKRGTRLAGGSRGKLWEEGQLHRAIGQRDDALNMCEHVTSAVHPKADMVFEWIAGRVGNRKNQFYISFAARTTSANFARSDGPARAHPHNPVAEMLFLRDVRRAEMTHREAVERIIDIVEFARYRHSAVGSLPFGIQKMVGFARALALEPRIMLLDEPSAGLNREERGDLARFILHIKHELNMAMIWIEHDMQMIADLADRIHVLDYGSTIAHGPPETVLADRVVKAAYLGTELQG